MGLYVESIKSNIRALKADNEYIKYKVKATKNKLPDTYYLIEYYAHNTSFLITDAERMGHFGYCKQFLPILENHVNKYIDIKNDKNVFLEHFLTIRCQVYLRFGKYKEILKLPKPDPLYKLWTTIFYYVRTIANATLKNKQAAFQDFELFVESNNNFNNEAPKESCRCGCSKRHGGISNPHFGLNKYSYFRKHGIPYEDNDINIRTCSLCKIGATHNKATRPGGITSPTHKINPRLADTASGTLTINNSKLLAKIRYQLCEGYLEWFFGKKSKAVIHFKKATDDYESLYYDEPASFFYTVHETYGGALYILGKYKESLKIAIRGSIPYPNQLKLVHLQSLNYNALNNKYAFELTHQLYKKLLELADYKPTLRDY